MWSYQTCHVNRDVPQATQVHGTGVEALFKEANKTEYSQQERKQESSKSRKLNQRDEEEFSVRVPRSCRGIPFKGHAYSSIHSCTNNLS